MVLLGILLSFLVGFSLLFFLANEFSIYVKIGLSFILGIAIQSFILFILTLIGLKFSIVTLLSVSLGWIGLFSFLSFKKYGSVLKLRINEADKIKFTFPLFLIFGLVLYLLYGATVKCLFWPIAEYDSMTGYDLMGKMIAKEGVFNTSIFQYPYATAYDVARFIYPPLVASGFAYFYVLGAVNAKIYIICLFISFVISFFGLLRNKVSDTLALFITLLMMITPEMFSHASLGLTNLPNAIYTSLSFLCFYFWLQNRQNSYFIVSLILMASSMWSRSDSVVFIAGYGLLFLIDFFKTKEWLKPLIFLGSCVLTFLIWNLFIKINIGANSSDFFLKSLFWDGEKFSKIFSKAFELMVGSGQLYGITFYVFAVFLAINIVDIAIAANRVVVFTVSTWFLYTMLYYQIDYGFAGSIEAYLNASYKRGLFNFVPLAWFFIATSPISEKWLGKCNNWLYNKS